MDIPDRLYLQIEHDGEPVDPSDWTHCADRVNDSDIEYVRVMIKGLSPTYVQGDEPDTCTYTIEEMDIREWFKSLPDPEGGNDDLSR